MDLDSQHKVNLIREINGLLIRHGQDQVNPEDFDILYDLEVDELVQAKHEIHTRLIQSIPHIIKS